MLTFRTSAAIFPCRMHWHVVASDTLAHTLSLTFPHRRDRGHAHSTRSPPLPLAIDRCNLLTSGKISVYISLHVSLLLLLCSVSYLIRRASQCRLSYTTETVLPNKITRSRIVPLFKDSPRKPLRRRPVHYWVS